MTSGYRTRTAVLLMLPFGALLLGIIVVPIVMLLSQSFGSDEGFSLAQYERLFGEPVYMRVVWRTVRISAIVMTLSLVLAYPLAYVMSRARGWVVGLLLAAVLVPLWTSVLVRSYAWIVLLQRNGIINSTLSWLGVISEPLTLLYTEGAVIVAMTQVMLPFMVLPIYGTLRGIDTSLVAAARSLGATSAAAFRQVTLPLSLPGITSGCVLVFVMSLGFFITPALVGGPKSQMISTLISEQVTRLLNFRFAGALSAVLVVIVLVLVLLFNGALRRAQEGR